MKKNLSGRVSALLLTAMMIALFVVAASGCGTKAKPSETLEQFYILMTERNFSEAYDLLASESQTRKLMTREVFVQQMEKQTPQGLALTAFSVSSESEEGDRAKVKYSVTIQEPDKEPRTNEAEAELALEDGKWKLL